MEPDYNARAASILARLAQVEINDNWSNKPADSLESIFKSWMPQTAATLEQRVELMRKLAKQYPDVAWKICVAQFSPNNDSGDYSHKPRWRPDGYGFGEPFHQGRQSTHLEAKWWRWRLPGTAPQCRCYAILWSVYEC
ncbi:hypothetical protein HFN45_32425 [Rhizobium leguminosarum]|nr:hypothetical protein [Rhizobium leguminosarum]